MTRMAENLHQSIMKKIFTCMSYCGEDNLGSGTFQPLLTPVGHRLDRQEVGSSRQQTLQPQLTLRLQHIKK